MNLNQTYLSDEISLKEDYDYEGAFFFIFFTIIFYGLFVIGLLYTLNQSSETDYYEDSGDPHELTARSLIKNLRAEDIVKRDALGIS
jgi:hypothetical protein